MVGLDHREFEYGLPFCFCHESETCPPVHLCICPCIRRSRMHIEKREHIQAFLVIDHPVNGVHLDQIPWFQRLWAFLVRMVSLVWAPFLQALIPIKHTVYGAPGHRDAFLFEHELDRFGTTAGFLAKHDDLLFDFLRDLCRFRLRFRRVCRYGHVTNFSSESDPSHHSRMVESEVSADLSGTPTLKEQPGGIPPDSWYMLV